MKYKKNQAEVALIGIGLGIGGFALYKLVIEPAMKKPEVRAVPKPEVMPKLEPIPTPLPTIITPEKETVYIALDLPHAEKISRIFNENNIPSTIVEILPERLPGTLVAQEFHVQVDKQYANDAREIIAKASLPSAIITAREVAIKAWQTYINL